MIQCKPLFRRSQDIELKEMEESLNVVRSESLSAYERKKELEEREAKVDQEIIQIDEEIGKLESKKDQINEQLLSQVSSGVGVNIIQKEHILITLIPLLEYTTLQLCKNNDGLKTTLENCLETTDAALANAEKQKDDAKKRKAAAHDKTEQAHKESQRLHSEQIKLEG